jgi:hypothetical protein
MLNFGSANAGEARNRAKNHGLKDNFPGRGSFQVSQAKGGENFWSDLSKAGAKSPKTLLTTQNYVKG